MDFRFSAVPYLEGSRTFIAIPFNVWEQTGQKGNLPCRIRLLFCDCSPVEFECKLLPKGGGRYLIPVGKAPSAALPCEKECSVELTLIDALTRINRNSPFSKDNPLRLIDCIRAIPIIPGRCGHCCIAMLADVPLSEVETLMGKGHASWSKLIEALDYYGINYAPSLEYTHRKAAELPPCCILRNGDGFVLWYKGSYCGVDSVDPTKTVGYLEILLP